MSHRIPINGNGASILIEVDGYERPGAKDISDANWLKCRVTLDIGYFKGNYSASFETTDFVRFKESLKTALKAMNGTASFETCEGALTCAIEIKSGGRARIKGTAQVREHIDATLSFSFESDQSFLAETLRETENTTAAYPMLT